MHGAATFPSTASQAAGLARYTHDHYAILGVPLTATAAQVREAYLQIVRHLHPDSHARSADPESEHIYSRWISPAYSTLSRPTERSSYDAALQLVLARLSTQNLPDHPLVEGLLVCRTLAELDGAYWRIVQRRAGERHCSPRELLAMAADLSQVNLAFLLLRRILADEAAVRREALCVSSPTPAEVPAALPSVAQRHFERGVQFLRRTLPGEAIPCFQECLRLEPEHPQAHACLGVAYLHAAQPRPAREHFRRALSLDPTNALANRFLQAMEAPRARPEPTPTVQSKSVPVAPTQAPGLLQRVLAFFRGRP